LKSENSIRLNKFIANSGICSRREADKFIEAGVITVNGKKVSLGYRVAITDIVKFNDQKILREKSIYILLNKPKKLDIDAIRREKNSAMRLISSVCKEKVFPVDKLNQSESGLLIFTNDQVLAKKITNKNQKIKSVYQVTLNKEISSEDVLNLKKGIDINGKKYRLTSISFLTKRYELGVEQNQGGIKILKLLFKKLNYDIISLDRVLLAGITKKKLPRNKFRYLTQEEINILKRL
jgi:23S rRNA pseudouridine2605 synthase